MKRTASVTIALALLISAVISAAPASYAAFDDTEGHWAYDTIEVMTAEGILSGYGDGTFRPDNTVTRAEFVKMMVAAFGLEKAEDEHFVPYADVSSADWYYTYISAALSDGFLIDYGITFEPHTELTREEAVTLLARYLNLPKENLVPLGSFTDDREITEDYRIYVLRAVYADLIWGYPDGTLRPHNTLTRAEALTLLKRAMETKKYDRTEETAYYTDDGGNLRVTDASMPITGIETGGDVYIPASVTGMYATFEDCTFSGTVYVESDVTVIFENCHAERIVLDMDSVKRGSITLKGNTYVNRVEMLKSGGIYCNEECSVGELYVGADAPRSGFSGAGILGNVEIHADGFSSSYKPGYAEMDNGLTCVLGGNMYNQYNIGELHSELKIAGGDTGFLVAPYLETVNGAAYISFIPARDGRVYYGTSSSASTAIGFSIAKGNIYRNVQAGTKAQIMIDQSLNFNLVKYYLLEFADDTDNVYSIVSVPVSKMQQDFSVNGFVGQVVFESRGGIDYLTLTAGFAGKLVWYYSESPGIPQEAVFKERADAILSSPNSSVLMYPELTAGQSVTVQLGITSVNQTWAAVALKLPNGGYTIPVIVTRKDYDPFKDPNGYVTDTVINAPEGFADVPKAIVYGYNDTVIFTPKTTCKVIINYYNDGEDGSLSQTPYITKEIDAMKSVKYSIEISNASIDVKYPRVTVTVQYGMGIFSAPYTVIRTAPDGAMIIKPTGTP
nr:S-layer homology domain-containing protein [Clostridia bacterium]